MSIRSAVCLITGECQMCRSGKFRNVGQAGLGISGEAMSLEKCRVRGQCRQAGRAMGKIQFRMSEASVDAYRNGMQGGLGIHSSFEETAGSQNWCRKLVLLPRLFGVVWHVCVVIHRDNPMKTSQVSKAKGWVRKPEKAKRFIH